MSNIDLKASIGLTQQQAGDILGMEQSRVAVATRAEPGKSPNRRTIELLVAVWPELDAAARQRVRARLEELRR